ncbi:MAG TPA: elongation factor EF-2 [archaeon]|nr:elongation factor EF-2 [archaeon]
MGRKEDQANLAQSLMASREVIRNIGIVAHIDHGKCVSPESNLFLVGGELITAEALFNNSSVIGKKIKENSNELIFDVSDQEILTYSLNKETGKVELKPITFAWKLKGGKLNEVILRNGLKIKTTPEHKFIVLHELDFKEKTAEQLKQGDRIVCPRNLPAESSKSIKQEILGKLSERNIYAKLNKNFSEAFKEKINGFKIERAFSLINSKIKLNSFRDNVRKGKFKLKDLLVLAKTFSISPEELYGSIELIFLRNNAVTGPSAKPMLLPKNFENFFYLAGLLFGDGSGDKFIVGKQELGSRFVEICHELGINPYFRNYSNKTPEIGAGSKTLLEALNALFDYPKNKKSKNISVSSFLMTSNSAYISEFIKAYFDCDGTVEKNRRAISIVSASKKMIEKLQLLLLRFNVMSITSVKKGYHNLHITGQSVKQFNSRIGFGLTEKQQKAFKLAETVVASTVLDLIPLSKEKLKELRGSTSMNSISHHFYKYESQTYVPTNSTVNNLIQLFKQKGLQANQLEKLANPDLSFIEVKQVKTAVEEVVFDFTVADNHNFVAEGMFIHNTTMTDNLVAAAGLISEELAGKQRIMDYEDQEQERGITINAANISLVNKVNGKDHLINLIDTPGHVDFGGEVIRAMRAVDGVVLVVDSVEGVMPQTETVIRQALRERVKPVLFINKVDRLISELQLTEQMMQERFIKTITKVNELIKANAPEEFKNQWIVAPSNGSVSFGSAYNKWAVSIPYMQKSGITMKDVYNFMKEDKQKELAKKSPLHEVIFKMVADHLPSPSTAQKYRIPRIWSGELESEIGKNMLSCSPSEPFSMMVTDVSVDPHAGDVATGRIFSGTVRKGLIVKLLGSKKQIHVQKVGLFFANEFIEVKEIPAGNIAALVGLKEVYSGETISTIDMQEFESFLTNVEPVMTISIEAQHTKDLPKLINAINALTKEDPNLKASINQETGEHLLSGMGELHLEVNIYRIEKNHGVKVKTSPPIVVYTETMLNPSPIIEGKSPNKHNKFKVSAQPLTEELAKNLSQANIKGKVKTKDKEWIAKFEGIGFDKETAKRIWAVHNNSVLVDRTRGIQSLHEIRELVIQGFKDAMDEGPLAKEKGFGVMVELHDASLHEDAIHRGPAQVLPAITRAIYASMLSGNAVIYEPKQTLTITVPETFMGAVTGQLSQRRTQILEIRSEGDQSIIIGKAPVAELIGFSADIRGATQGRALWTAEYSGYEMLPREMQTKIITEIRKRKGMDAEVKTAEFFMD